MTGKISEIKFINDNNDILISKIDLTNNKLNTIINDISIDLKEFIFQFTESLNDNIKSIENKFNKQNDELEKLKKELENKNFDDKNYMNVSITMNLAKQIKERDLKIKELEQRIRFIENKKSIEVIPEVVIPEVVIPEATKSKSKKISLKNKKEENIESLDKSSKKNIKKLTKNEIEESKSIEEIPEEIKEEIKEEIPEEKIVDAIVDAIVDDKKKI